MRAADRGDCGFGAGAEDGGVMATKFTPGPWTLETVKTSSGICHKIGPFPWRPDRQNHACIYHDYPNGTLGPVELELRANARLITAAPELHDALTKAAAEFREQERRCQEAGDAVAQEDGYEAAEPYLAAALRNREMAALCEAALAKAGASA